MSSVALFLLTVLGPSSQDNPLCTLLEFMKTEKCGHTIDSLDGRFMLSRPVTDGFPSESPQDVGSRSTTL